MDDILLKLLEQLEAVGDLHEELYDSDVRGALDRAVVHGFLKPDPQYSLPDDFGMFSAEANAIVRDAMSSFLVSAREVARDRLHSFHQRLSAFQNLELRTGQQNDYNDFFGWANPDDYDESGFSKRA